MPKDIPDLIQAVLGGNLPEVISVLENDVEVNAKDKFGRTALHHAVIDKNFEICKILVAHKADVSVPDHAFFTPLHFAAQEYALEITELLIQNNAIIDAKNEHGNTPLWIAVFNSRGRGEIIQLLLQAGADPHKENNSGVSPLKLAQTIANFDIKRFFEERS